MPTTSLADVVRSLPENPYFGAVAGAFGLGAVAAFARRAAVVANTVARRRLVLSLEVSNEDPAYEWLLRWLNKSSKSSGGVSSRQLSVRTDFSQSESGRVRTAFAFIPAPGEHYVWYANRLIKVERNRESQMVRTNSGSQMGVPFETLTLSTFGTNPALFSRMLQSARADALEQLQRSTMIYHPVGPEWRPFGNARRKRDIESVVLDDGVAERLLGDVHEFINNAQWYTTRGIPYRRGYLLYGPPGCGKSSFISALASHLDYSICVLSMSERTMTDDRLDRLLNTAPLQSLILLEDIDAAFAGSRADHPSLAAAYDGLSRVTFSGLLNAIDGVASAEARLLCMTTNYVQRLDDALIRPGRVDMKQYIGTCTHSQLRRMFARFFMDSVDATPELSEKFAVRALEGGKPISAAQAQGYLLMYKTAPQTAVECAHTVCAYGQTVRVTADTNA